jgi:hypothetical protein
MIHDIVLKDAIDTATEYVSSTSFLIILFCLATCVANIIVRLKVKKLSLTNKYHEKINDQISLFYRNPLSPHLPKRVVDAILSSVSDKVSAKDILRINGSGFPDDENFVSATRALKYEYALMRQHLPELNNLFQRITRNAVIIISLREGGRLKPSRAREIQKALLHSAERRISRFTSQSDLTLVLEAMERTARGMEREAGMNHKQSTREAAADKSISSAGPRASMR